VSVTLGTPPLIGGRDVHGHAELSLKHLYCDGAHFGIGDGRLLNDQRTRIANWVVVRGYVWDIPEAGGAHHHINAELTISIVADNRGYGDRISGVCAHWLFDEGHDALNGFTDMPPCDEICPSIEKGEVLMWVIFIAIPVEGERIIPQVFGLRP
jgi:hypothetical protein